MTAIRRAEIVSVEDEHGGDALCFALRILEGPLAGEVHPGVFYLELGGVPSVGEVVLANTVGIEMRLGTGGAAFILPTSGGSVPENRSHFVKMPYTPMQFPASVGEQAENLSGVPVVVLPLHSHLAVACSAAAAARPGSRVVFVWREGGALPVAFSRSVVELKEKGLLHGVVSSGSCFGGDTEAPNEYSALLAAAGGADVILAGIGPGVVGTAAVYGHGGMSAATSLNAAFALGGDPVLAPRISFADERGRHFGISHHTRSVLEAALGGCRVAFPKDAMENISLEGLPERHSYVSVEFGAAGLEEGFGLTFESMGRRYKDDSVFFDAAAAAVRLALGESSA